MVEFHQIYLMRKYARRMHGCNSQEFLVNKKRNTTWRYAYRNYFRRPNNEIMQEQHLQMVVRKGCIIERINGWGR
jgi:ABC-type phosphate/phosphonate transport system ATPase subunit